ncbi:MAG: long-chain fatty acid--CoA ligase [Actinobacteria bacterium]|nr:long-chain fatty acid--CoA ligase [Actinomycetota bacterium]
MREYSTPAAVDIPPSAGLTDVMFERAERDPSAVVMRRRAAGGGGWQDVTARQFADDVTALAKGLIAGGIAAGDRVALMSRTRYEWTIADYAIWSAGAATVPIYETSSAEQVEWILADSGARALIVETPAHLQTAAEVLTAAPHVTRVWQIESPAAPAGQDEDSTGLAVPGHPVPVEPLTALAAAGAGVSDDEVHQRRQSRHAADLATIIYTSGTTGRPKGCALSHANLLADVRNVVHGWLSAIFEAPEASTLLFLPLAHSFARIIQVGCLEFGVVLGHTPSVATLLPDLASFQPTFILAVPRVFEKVYNGAEQGASASPVKSRIFHAAAQTAVAWSRASGTGAAAPSGGPGAPLRLQHALFDRLVYAKLRGAVGGRVRYAVSGGGPLGERLGHFFRGAGITVLEGYGLTESSAAATVNRPEHIKIGTVGQPLPGVSVKIADDGEIFLAGPTIFGGYWRNDAATAEVMADGWLRTGDIGELDDDGFLRVTGRKKELIVTAGGKNVAPAVLEDRIRAHPLVSQVLVVGDARPYVACLITLDEEALEIWKAKFPHLQGAATAELIKAPELLAELQGAVDEANKAVSRAEAVRRFRVLPGDFTEQGGHLTPSLKVRRNVIMKDFAGDVEALYS